MALPLTFVLFLACTRDSAENFSKQKIAEQRETDGGSDTIRLSADQITLMMKNADSTVNMSLDMTLVNATVYIQKNGQIYTIPYRELQDYKAKEEEQSRIAIGKEMVFRRLSKEASYPGGVASWLRYLSSNFEYPQPAIEKEVQGTVVVQFIVNANGNVTDVEATSGPEELRPEAIRMIKRSGKWVPGEFKGKKVHSYKKQPIRFVLQPA